MIQKISEFVPFGPNLSHFGLKSDILDLDKINDACNLQYLYRKQEFVYETRPKLKVRHTIIENSK